MLKVQELNALDREEFTARAGSIVRTFAMDPRTDLCPAAV